jgi:hypothetical protein
VDARRLTCVMGMGRVLKRKTAELPDNKIIKNRDDMIVKGLNVKYNSYYSGYRGISYECTALNGFGGCQV